MAKIEGRLDGQSSKDSGKTGAFLELPRAMCPKSDISMQVINASEVGGIFFKNRHV